MRKHLFSSMLAATGILLLASCSSDELETNQLGNDTQMTFVINLDNGIGASTRAISDGTQANKLVYAVYNEEGELVENAINSATNGQGINENAFSDGLTDNVNLTLAKGQQYTIAFWAQNKECTAYDTGDLKNVTISYDGGNNDEPRDAFFCAKTFTVTGSQTIDVTLKRPFAQINVGVTQQDWNAAVASDIEVKQSKVVVKNAATSINLLTGATSGSQEVTYSLADIPAENLMVDADNDGTKEAYKWLSMSYILVADESEDGTSPATLESLQFTFKPESGQEIVFDDGLNNVPVQRNWRTNILGQILSSNAQFNITLDPAYDNDNDVVLAGNAAELQEAINNGGLVTLTEDVTITEALVVPADKSVEIDLNGNDIVNNTSIQDASAPQYGNTTVFQVLDGATLDIRGEGNVHAISTKPDEDGYRIAVYALGSSTVNIYGGNYYNSQDYNNGQAQLDLIYADQESVINIYGGRFESACANDRGYWVLNLKDNSNAAINVYGGTFINFDPSSSHTENPIKNFVAEGYSSVEISSSPLTYKVVKGEAVSSAEEIENAIATAIENGSNTVYTTKSITFTNDVEIDGKGVVFEGSPVYFNGNATVRNVTFANGINATGNGSAVYVTNGASKNITFEGCTFTNAQWDAIQLTDKDIESVTIKDCNFRNTVEGGYRYIHLELRNGGQYVANETAKLTITGCTFENITKDYCKDSAITILGFKFDNMTIEGNTIKGEAPEALDSNHIWICDGNNFGALMTADQLNQAFAYAQ